MPPPSRKNRPVDVDEPCNRSGDEEQRPRARCRLSPRRHGPLLLRLLLLLLLVASTATEDSRLAGGGTVGSSCQTVCACKWKGGKQTVECIDRALIAIPSSIDSNTQVLDMSGNNLQILPPDTFVRAGLVNLQRLHLRNCKLGQIDADALRGLTNLIELDLSHNLLTAIPARPVLAHVASLRELTLASNPIQKVEARAFGATHSLTKLDLSHCDLHTIAPDAFGGLTGLHALKLNGNRLAELLPLTIETLRKLHGVELHDNPWLCDCHLRAAKIWLTVNNVPYPVAPVCAGGPERVIDRTFAELQVDDFACRPEMRPSAAARHVEATTGDNATIECWSSAVPAPTVSWYWNGRLLLNGSAFSAHQQLWVYEDGEFERRSRLVLTNAQETDSSEFYCVADNRAGTAEANFTLHVAMRAAGMAALGNRQLIGITAVLAVLVVAAMFCMALMLVRYRRSPYAESKTPVGRMTGTGAHSPTAAASTVTASTTSSTGTTHRLTANGKSGGGGGGGGAGGTFGPGGGGCIERDAAQLSTGSVGSGGGGSAEDGGMRGGQLFIGGAPTTGGGSAATNPLQKPPRLTDIHYTASPYASGDISMGSMGRPTRMYVSPTGSAAGNSGNNPDLISSATGSQLLQQRNNVDELTHLSRVDAMLSAAAAMSESTVAAAALRAERPGSGAYSRAGGCDSLYPSGLWPTPAEPQQSQQSPPQQSLSKHQHELVFLRRTASTTIPTLDYQRGGAAISYTEKTPIVQAAAQLSSQLAMNMDDESSSADFMCRTFPRSGIYAAHQFGGGSGGGIGGGGGGSGGSGGLLGGSSHQQQFSVVATSSGCGGVDSTSAVPATSGKPSVGGYPSDYGLPLVHGAEHLRSSRDVLPPPGMPANAKTLRVWQRGGVPVLPPVTALKRALTSSRNSPDEGYQEGCGTDV